VKNILSICLILAISFGFTQPVTNKKLPNITISDLQGKPVNIQEIIEVAGKADTTLSKITSQFISRIGELS